MLSFSSNILGQTFKMIQGEDRWKTGTVQLYEMIDTQLNMAGTGGSRAEDGPTPPKLVQKTRTLSHQIQDKDKFTYSNKSKGKS